MEPTSSEEEKTLLESYKKLLSDNSEYETTRIDTEVSAVLDQKRSRYEDAHIVDGLEEQLSER